MTNMLKAVAVSGIHQLRKLGWSNRRIACKLRIHRDTVARYLKLLDVEIAASGKASPVRSSDSKLYVTPVQRPASSRSKCAGWRDEILSGLKNGKSIRHIHREILASANLSYESTRRFVRRLRQELPNRGLRHDGARLQSVSTIMEWMLGVLVGGMSLRSMQDELGGESEVSHLFDYVQHGSLKQRHKALTILAAQKGAKNSTIAQFLHLNRATVARYREVYSLHGSQELFAPTRTTSRKSDDPSFANPVIATLHTPPSAHGINRTTWKQSDLKRILAGQGVLISCANIRSVLRKSGYRWRKAKRVLTSTDPHYLEKLQRITKTLAAISGDERFFSIDEFGPFHITRKPGRKLVAPGEEFSVPQRQKSRGRLIVTAALELCTNQVTHFYSDKKNTAEMLRLLDVLLQEYSQMRTLYLSWDAASWHISKKFYQRVNELNGSSKNRPSPRIELIPLPSCAQFLNVIESVFSGMARAIVHNSVTVPESAWLLGVVG